MAGGLVGALLGGSGAGYQQMTAQASPAASLLAKLQTGGLTADEERQLTQVLTETYDSVIELDMELSETRSLNQVPPRNQ